MRKRSIRIRGHATSVSLEDEFWTVLLSLAAAEKIGVDDLIARIDGEKKGANLSSALRIHILQCAISRDNQA